jgi:hypothetical protein
MSFILSAVTYIYTATIQRTHCCTSVAALSTFIALLTATHVSQQYKGNTSLLFHCNSGYTKVPQRYVLPTLPSLLHFGIPLMHRMGRDSSVGIATGYGLDLPRFKSRQGREFSHTSSPILGPTQLPVKWVRGLSRG